MTQPGYKVKAAPREDIGKDRIRFHYLQRGRTERFTIMNVAGNGKSRLLCVMGHEADEKDAQMDMDVRRHFDVSVDQVIQIEINPVGWFGKLQWYLSATDPAVRVPAWLGLWSFVVGMISFIPMVVDLVRWLN